jgi:thiol-disulfide isomerase/thioredoxin
MRKTGLLLFMVVASLQMIAQKLQLKIEFPASDVLADAKMYAGPINGDYESIQEMTSAGNVFSADVDASESGFYNVTCVRNQTQAILPLYLEEKEGEVLLKAKLEGNLVRFEGNADNAALSAFNIDLADLTIQVWKSGKDMSDKKLRKLFDDYEGMVKKADPKKKASAPVKEYLDIWAYTSVYNLVNSLPRIIGRPASEISFKASDILPAPVDVLDSPVASLFPIAADIVRQRLPKGELAEQIDYLRANYETQDLRTKVEERLLSSYVARYDYASDFDGGLQQLQALTDKYQLDSKYVEQFKKNRSTIKGTPFPADVVLKDKEGNVVDFASFKGKYVYIDVWASWCGPCIKQIPHLQKLEEELQNDNVVFVSISVDAKESPWLKKMESLGVHGNQLWDSNAQLCSSLNISGIPFFLIYDAEGKLYMYDAPRPSQGEGLKMMLEGLGK